jgi:hypothetical protein
MGNVVPIVIARAVKRGIMLSADAMPLLSNMSELLRSNLHFELIAVKELELGWSKYDDILRVALSYGYKVCPPEVAIPLAASGPESPIVHVAMVPQYKNGEYSLLRVTNMDTAAYIESITFKTDEIAFAPHAVFAFLR